MLRFAIHRDAVNDLQSIKAAGHVADHGVILAFLQQAKVDPSLLESLSEDWFGEDGCQPYSVRKVVSLHQQGRRIWRVKVLTLKGLSTEFRILYTFDARAQVFFVLGIPHRDIVYDQTHHRIRRLIDVYDGLDLS